MMTILALALLTVLAVVLLAAAAVSYREYRQRQSTTGDAYTLLKTQLDLTASAADAQKEMLRVFCQTQAQNE